MTLITCEECGKEHSDTIEACPHCGYIRGDHQSTEPTPPEVQVKSTPTWKVFLVIIPIVCIGGFIYVKNSKPTKTKTTTSTRKPVSKYFMWVHEASQLRKAPDENEKSITEVMRGSKVQILDFNIDNWAQVLYVRDTGYVEKGILKNTPLPSVEVVDYAWRKDPGFGVDGAIIWTVELKNNSSNYIKNKKVEITIYDNAGKVTDTDNIYVSGLQPYGKASGKGYATYFGTESRASVRIID